MEEHISELFGNGLFSCVYYVDSNPGRIESVEIKKEGDKIVESKSTMEFNLRRVSFYKSGSMSLDVRKAVKHEFFKSLRFASEMKEFRYFKRGWKGLFSKRDPRKLAKHIEGFDWAIAPNSIADELALVPGYEAVIGGGDIRLKGKIGSTFIFKCDDAEGIFLGNKDSIVPAFRRGIFEVPKESGMASLEMAFDQLGTLKKIWVH